MDRPHGGIDSKKKSAAFLWVRGFGMGFDGFDLIASNEDGHSTVPPRTFQKGTFPLRQGGL